MSDVATGQSDSSTEDPLERFLAELLGRIEDRLTTYEDAIHEYPELADRIRRMQHDQRLVAGIQQSLAPQIPKTLGIYKIEGVAARGGMGLILRAIDENLRREVAIKTIRPERHSEDLIRRFRREQETLARLYHESIVALFASGSEGGVDYFVMPFIPGATLREVIVVMRRRSALDKATSNGTIASFVHSATGGRAPSTPSAATENWQRSTSTEINVDDSAPSSPPPASNTYWRSVAELVVQAADAVDHMHGRNVFHRDLKPSNIMIAANGRLSIIDVGLAAYKARTDDSAYDPCRDWNGDPEELRLSLTWTYAAPEQFNRRHDARTDVWGLGVVLYELLTLEPPFRHRRTLQRGDDCKKLLAARDAEHPKHPREIVPAIPADLAAICWKAMGRDSGDRFSTAKAMSDDLRRFLRGAEVKARPRSLGERIVRWTTKHRARAALLATLIVALPTIIGVLLFANVKAQAERDEQRRQVILSQLQALLHSDLRGGWSRIAMEQVREAAKIRIDGQLRDAAVEAFTGLDVQSVKELEMFGASSAAYDPTGKWLALGGTDVHRSLNLPASPAKLWHLDEDKPREGKAQGPGLVAFQSDDVPVQVSGSPSGEVKIVHILTGETIQSLTGLQPTTSRSSPVIAVSENANVVAASFRKGTSTVLWTRNGRQHCLDQGATALAISRDGSLLALGTEGGRVSIWSTADGRRLDEYQISGSAVLAIGINRSATRRGDRIDARIAAGGVGRYSVIDAVAHRIVCTFESTNDTFKWVTFAPDDSRILANGSFFDATTGEFLLRATGGENAAFSPLTGELCAVRSQGYGPPSVIRYAVRPPPGVDILNGLDARPAFMAFSRDGRRVAAVSFSWRLAVWDVETGALLRILDVPEGPWADNSAIILSGDGAKVTAASGEVACQWNVSDGALVSRWKLPPGGQNCLAYTRNGELFLARTELKSEEAYPYAPFLFPQYPRTQRIRSLKSKDQLELINELNDSPDRTYGLELSGDGERLLMSGLDKENNRCVRLFDTRNGELVKRYDLGDVMEHDSLRADPTGAFMSFGTALKTTTIIRASDGAIVPFDYPAVTALGPNIEFCLADVTDKSSYRFAVARRGDKEPVLTRTATSGYSAFSVDGRSIAHGTGDGAIALINLPRVEEFFTDQGLR